MAPHELYIWSSKLLQIPLSYFFWYTHTNLELVGTQGTFSSFGKSLMKILFLSEKRHILIYHAPAYICSNEKGYFFFAPAPKQKGF